MRLVRPTFLAPAVALTLAAPASALPLLRFDGIGPLTLGMQQSAAVRTGWLVRHGHGCELGGTPFPATFSITGAKAPRGIEGTAEFSGRTGKLDNLSFGKGVRTATGVVVGRTTASGMVTRYRRAGYAASARYDSTFRGTFVQIRKHKGGRIVMMGFATKSKLETIGIPVVPVCE